MKNLTEADLKNRKFITIQDTCLIKQIIKIMTVDEYSKSFNKVINDALFRGLPILEEELFGDCKRECSEDKAEGFTAKREIDKDSALFYTNITRLLEENTINILLCKSIVSALYRAKEEELDGLKVDKEGFKNGIYDDTPDHLTDFEEMMFKKVLKKRG